MQKTTSAVEAIWSYAIGADFSTHDGTWRTEVPDWATITINFAGIPVAVIELSGWERHAYHKAHFGLPSHENEWLDNYVADIFRRMFVNALNYLNYLPREEN